MIILEENFKAFASELFICELQLNIDTCVINFSKLSMTMAF